MAESADTPRDRQRDNAKLGFIIIAVERIFVGDYSFIVYQTLITIMI